MKLELNPTEMNVKRTKRLLISISIMLLGLLALASSSCTAKYTTSEHTGVIVDKLGLDSTRVGGQYKYMYGFVVKEDSNPEKQIIFRPYDVYSKGDTLCWTITKRRVNK